MILKPKRRPGRIIQTMKEDDLNTSRIVRSYVVLYLFVNLIRFVDGYTLNGLHVEGLKFNKRLGDHFLRTFDRVSLGACYKECDRRALCLSVNYHRPTAACELVGVDESLYPMARDERGWVSLGKKQPMVTRPCGHQTCAGNQVCDERNNSCVFEECSSEVPVPAHGSVIGNRLSTGSKLSFRCDTDFVVKSRNRYHMTLTSECLLTGEWSVDEFECVPATCHVRGQMSPSLPSGLYPYTDKDTGERIQIFCDFQNGFGYTFISKDDFGKLGSLSVHYTRTDYVVLRHFREDGIQKEANVSVLPPYSALYNVTILLNDTTDFRVPNLYGLSPYILVGFVPNSYGSKENQWHGYVCNNREIRYYNCDINSDNYLAVFTGTSHQPFEIPEKYFDIGYAWVTWAVAVDSSRYLPTTFFGLYEMGMGGCGAFMTADYDRGMDTALGMAIGMRFDL